MVPGLAEFSKGFSFGEDKTGILTLTYIFGSSDRIFAPTAILLFHVRNDHSPFI